MTTEYVETRMVMIDELEPYPGNARLGDKATLVESLEANGQYRSLIVRETGDGLVVLCGNNTLAALEDRGDLEARCEIVRCDDATALRVNLIDNRANDKATYDEQARAALLVLLDGAIAGTGYSEEEADALVARYEEPDVTPYEEPDVTFNDDEDEREARIASRGGHESQPMASRGLRDIILVLSNADADELGRIILSLRKEFGTLPQGEILLKGMRIAVAALDVTADGSDGVREHWITYADEVYGAEADSDDGADDPA